MSFPLHFKYTNLYAFVDMPNRGDKIEIYSV